ncbi:MAG: site-specific tyrosine recombinase [Bacillota bacterium]|nr:site-specific tyrosine recombinase [Bacillota bacterium]
MNELVDRYLQYISEDKKLSLNTIDAYRRDITKFKEFLSSNSMDFNKVDKITLLNYIQTLSTSGRKESSIARSIICIRNFYKFLYKNGLTDMVTIIDYDIPKYKRNTPEILTVEEVNKLLCTPDINTCKGIRDKAMLEMMYASGIKISEMLNLKVEDVDLNFNYLRCKGLKGLERIIPLGNYCITWMKSYTEIRDRFNVLRTDFLFLNNKGDKMTRQGFWKIIKYYAKKADIQKDINLYTLRHSIAVHLIENGADIRSLKELLGYKDISAVQVYIDIIHKNKLMDVYKSTHPRA